MNVVKIQIDTKTFVRFWLVVIGFALIALAIYSARTALIIIGFAFFLAIALSPVVNRLARKLPSKSRVLSTAIAYLVVLVLLGVIVFLVLPPIIDQTAKFVNNLPSLIESASSQSSVFNRFIDKYNLQPEIDRLVVSLRGSVQVIASAAGSIVVTSIGSVVNAVTGLILVLVLSFLMLVEGPTWIDRLWKLYRDKSRLERHKQLLANMYSVVNSYVVGQLTVAAIGGTIAGVVVFILSLIFNIPSNLAIPTAAIVSITSLIPMFGATIGAVIISAILALNNVTAALIFIIFFVIYQQIEGNYISPAIQSKRINLSALVILMSVTIGIYVFGIIGGIISVPIAGCIKVLLINYLSSRNQVTKPA